MKRIEALAPLSREHHESLILAQLLRQDAPEYKGLPDTTQGKVQYACNHFQNKIKGHFEKEELMMQKVRLEHPDLEPMLDDILQDHRMLKKLFEALPGSETNDATLDVLGHLLNKHIRKEERVLFPQLQEKCSPELLSEIHDLLH